MAAAAPLPPSPAPLLPALAPAQPALRRRHPGRGPALAPLQPQRAPAAHPRLPDPGIQLRLSPGLRGAAAGQGRLPRVCGPAAAPRPAPHPRDPVLPRPRLHGGPAPARLLVLPHPALLPAPGPRPLLHAAHLVRNLPQLRQRRLRRLRHADRVRNRVRQPGPRSCGRGESREGGEEAGSSSRQGQLPAVHFAVQEVLQVPRSADPRQVPAAQRQLRQLSPGGRGRAGGQDPGGGGGQEQLVPGRGPVGPQEEHERWSGKLSHCFKISVESSFI